MFFPFYITIHSKQFNSKVAVARMKKYIRQTWTINSAILNTMNNFILTPSQSPCPRIYLDGLKSSNIGKVSWLHRTNCGGFRFRRFLCAVISIARPYCLHLYWSAAVTAGWCKSCQKTTPSFSAIAPSKSVNSPPLFQYIFMEITTIFYKTTKFVQKITARFHLNIF